VDGDGIFGCIQGGVVGESLREYIEMLNEETVSKEERKQRLVSLKIVKNGRQPKKNSDKLSLNKFQTRIIANSSLKHKQPDDQQDRREEEGPLSKKARELIESIKEDERKQEEQAGEAHESDGFSEGGSDSESGAEDLPEGEMKAFQDDLFSYMQEFREKFYREKVDRQHSMKEPARRKPDND
jgi:hypothetical protein